MELKSVVIPYENTKEDFLVNVPDGEYIITSENELYPISGYEDPDEYDTKEHLIVSGLATRHTTDWVRFYFAEKYPNIDFDKEFETDKPGVFGRIQEKYGHEYEEWVNEKKYQALEKELEKLGYRIQWTAE